MRASEFRRIQRNTFAAILRHNFPNLGFGIAAEIASDAQAFFATDDQKRSGAAKTQLPNEQHESSQQSEGQP